MVAEGETSMKLRELQLEPSEGERLDNVRPEAPFFKRLHTSQTH